VVVFVLVAVGLTVLVVTAPLRSGRVDAEDERRAAALADLEAAKEAKYREIRDAELDREMGKLSQGDWRAVDRELRAEAIEILRQLDRLEGKQAG